MKTNKISFIVLMTVLAGCTHTRGQGGLDVMDFLPIEKNEIENQTSEQNSEKNKEAEKEAEKIKADALAEAEKTKADANAYAQATKGSADTYAGNKKTEADTYAEQTKGNADTYAEQTKGSADTYAQTTKGNADTYAEQKKGEADTYAQTTKGNADTYAEQTKGSADTYAEQKKTEADAEAEQTRANAQSEVEQILAAAREEAERQIEAEKQAIKDAEAEAKRQAEEERLNAPAKEIEELSEIAGSLSENSINSIYGRSYSYIDGIKVDEYDYFSNEYSTFREETGDGWGSYNDYPKYFSLNETENGVIATTQIDSYSYSCDDRAENCGLYNNPTKYTSKSIKKNPDGLISFVMTNPGSSRAIKVMLGAGQIDDYNSTYYSYQDYGIWQYGKMQNGEFVPTVGIDALNNYAVLYNKNGNSDLIRESSQRSDILDNVVFTGKTNAVKTQRYEGTSQELSGNVKLTLGFQDKSENYAYNPKANIELDFKDWKKISFDANTNNHNYSGYFDISNVKINDVETPVNGTLKMNFDKVAEHSARIGGIEIPNVVVNEYDKATGVYGFQGILDGDSTEVVGGFVSKAIDDNNRFAVAPDIYYY